MSDLCNHDTKTSCENVSGSPCEWVGKQFTDMHNNIKNSTITIKCTHICKTILCVYTFQNDLSRDMMEAIMKFAPIAIELERIAKNLIISPKQYFNIMHVAIIYLVLVANALISNNTFVILNEYIFIRMVRT